MAWTRPTPRSSIRPTSAPTSSCTSQPRRAVTGRPSPHRTEPAPQPESHSGPAYTQPEGANAMTSNTSVPILDARGLTRSFGAVRALDAADFDVHPGEVVALIGDNGAGKSTLVKAFSGNLALELRHHPLQRDRGRPQLAERGQPSGHRDGLPGSRARPAPDAGAEHVPGDVSFRLRECSASSGSWTTRPCGSGPKRPSTTSAPPFEATATRSEACLVDSAKRSPSREPLSGPSASSSTNPPPL